MKLRLSLFLALFSSLAFGTATVTGKVSTPSTSVAAGSNFVQFELQGCGNNPAHATQGGEAATLTASARFPIDASGNIVAADGVSTATIVRNDQISCGGQTTSTFYLVTIFINNSPVAGQPQKYRITASPFDLNSATPITVNPVVVTPTGDTTYARLDGGNLPFAALVSAPGFNGAETTAPACGSAVDYLWPDSTAHRWKMCNNAGAADQVVGADATQTLTHKTYDTAAAGNSLLINGLAATANTGTGAVVRATNATIAPASVAINGDTAMTAAPRMTWGASIPVLTALLNNVAFFMPDKAITITRLQLGESTAAAACGPNAVISIFDGSSNIVSVTVAGSAPDDSGPLTVNVAAGTNLRIRVTTAAAACGTTPINVTATVQYRMQ